MRLVVDETWQRKRHLGKTISNELENIAKKTIQNETERKKDGHTHKSNSPISGLWVSFKQPRFYIVGGPKEEERKNRKSI